MRHRGRRKWRRGCGPATPPWEEAKTPTPRPARAARRSRRIWPGRRHDAQLGCASSEQRVFQDAIERAPSILNADLFALLICAAIIGNADFVENEPLLGELGGDFRLETEAIFLDRDRLDDVAPEYLVTGLHVRQIEVR